jgi:hypothetical protein
MCYETRDHDENTNQEQNLKKEKKAVKLPMKKKTRQPELSAAA